MRDLTLKMLLASLEMKCREDQRQKMQKKKADEDKKQRLETLHHVTFTIFSHQCVKLNYNVPGGSLRF